MNPRDTRVLTECDTLLADISTRYQTALDRLHEASPGFNARCVGSGDPGGGKGARGDSKTERLAEKRHPELDALERINDGPNDIVSAVGPFAKALSLPEAYTDATPSRMHIARLAWCRWVIRRLLASNLEPASRPLNDTHRSIVNLHRTVTAWAYTAKKPTKTTPTRTPSGDIELPEDLTGEWCRSCLRVGMREPRFRGDLCEWCYRFHHGEGFLPPPTIIEARASGKRITETMVAPHRQAHRERNKKRRRKAG